jgi:hypothetical protein
MHVPVAMFESIHSERADQDTRLNAIACPQRDHSLKENE